MNLISTLVVMPIATVPKVAKSMLQIKFFDFGNDLIHPNSGSGGSKKESNSSKPALDFFNDLDFGAPTVTETLPL